MVQEVSRRQSEQAARVPEPAARVASVGTRLPQGPAERDVLHQPRRTTRRPPTAWRAESRSCAGASAAARCRPRFRSACAMDRTSTSASIMANRDGEVNVPDQRQIPGVEGGRGDAGVRGVRGGEPAAARASTASASACNSLLHGHFWGIEPVISWRRPLGPYRMRYATEDRKQRTLGIVGERRGHRRRDRLSLSAHPHVPRHGLAARAVGEGVSVRRGARRRDRVGAARQPEGRDRPRARHQPGSSGIQLIALGTSKQQEASGGKPR